MRIVISGLGVMGASMALALRQRLPGSVILGYDFPHVQEEALSKNIIHFPIKHWPQECESADLVVLATPLRIIQQQLNELNGVVSQETVLTDVGSTKAELFKLGQSINFSGTYVGGHPMTGAEKSGLKAADPLLYENTVYILCGVNSLNENLLKQKLFPVLDALKARIMLLDPHTHDQIMASVSHVPQLLAIALINLVGAKNEANGSYFDLAAGGFRDLTRIASSSIDIWQDIFCSNKENVRQALQEMILLLEHELSALDHLQKDFEQANSYREQLPKTNKGFLSPLVDVLVYVNDQVGVLAKITNALARRDTDIRDIELLKVREREGGVFRMSFSNRKQAEKAVSVLNSINYQAFVRE